jgi:hypothetical protein
MSREQMIDIRDNAPDDVPLEVIAQAKAVYSQRAQELLATLVWDSLIDEGAPGRHHHLRFESSGTWLEVSVSVLSGWATLYGVMHPAVPVRVELQSAVGDGPYQAEVSRTAFRIERFPRGLVRLRLAGVQGSRVLCTDWFHV